MRGPHEGHEGAAVAAAGGAGRQHQLTRTTAAGERHPGLRSTQGRVVQPHLIRDPTALESLASHWRTWAPFEGTLSSPSKNPALIRSHASTVDDSNAQGATFAEDEHEPTPDGIASTEPTAVEPTPCSERIIWSEWDHIITGSSTRRLLILAYAPLGLAVWDCSSLDAWYEVLNLRSIANLIVGTSKATSLPGELGAITGACILPRLTASTSPHDSEYPLLAILTRPSTSARSNSPPSSHVFVYSLHSHSLVRSWSVPGCAHRIAANARQLVISTSSPLALHIHSAVDFTALPFSPLRDVAPSPLDGSPVFDLGRGGRALAYATDRKVVAGASSAARFDEREVARPGAGILAHRGFFDAEEPNSSGHSGASGTSATYDRAAFFEDARAAGAVGGEVARRVGGGVMYGAKAIGNLGYQYWTSNSTSSNAARANGGASVAGSPPDDRSESSETKVFSKSAPLPSVPGWERRTPSGSPQLSAFGTLRSTCDTHSPTSGTIVVVDLRSATTATSLGFASNPRQARQRSRTSGPASPTVLAHFRAYNSPIARVSLSPSSASVLVAPSNGHSFDIFELRNAVRVGRNAMGVSGSSGVASYEDGATRIGKVWHRYRLNRGMTSARTTTVAWSDDARLVAIGTGKGTTHVYAMQPSGGRPDLSTQLGAHVVNEQDLAPLSTSLSTIARIRRGPTAEANKTDLATEASFSLTPRSVFVSKVDSMASSLRPELPTPPCRSTPRLNLMFQDLLLFCPSTGACQLERLQASPAPSTTAEAASRGDVGRLASTAVSGLTQLMKSRGGATASASSGGGTMSTQTEKKEWVVNAMAKAEWTLAREREPDEVMDPIEEEDGGEARPSKSVTRFSAQAEIETFSRSPRVLPRSIYSSQQFAFFALPSDHVAQQALGQPPRPLRRLEMRSEVEIREGGSAICIDRGDDASPVRVASSFDQPIKSAMQTILDDPLTAQPSSSPSGAIDPFAHPGFPNGVAGKQGRHAHSGLAIPIRVGASVRQGLVSTVRGVVAMSVPAGQHLRRRASGGTSTSAGGYYSSSVSFEDDAVFAASNAGDDESASTGCTSELDEDDDDSAKLEMTVEEEDEAAWGWADDDIRTPSTTRIKGRRASTSIAEHPFEEDFDDFAPEPQSAAVTGPKTGQTKNKAVVASMTTSADDEN